MRVYYPDQAHYHKQLICVYADIKLKYSSLFICGKHLVSILIFSFPFFTNQICRKQLSSEKFVGGQKVDKFKIAVKSLIRANGGRF